MKAVTINRVKVLITETYDDMSREAAKLFIEQIKKKPNSVLGFTTGSTPIGLYKELVKTHTASLDFSKLTTFNLDEYYPIEQEHDQSYWHFMHRELFDHVNIPEDHIHILNGKAQNVEVECAQYEQKIKEAGGIDLQVLGIGNNGHIAFNEPGSRFNSRTRKISLDESTIEANSRFFASKNLVPKQALSMGLGTIRESQAVILLASGAKKAEAVKKSLLNHPSENVPASVLQKHPRVTFILDAEAASLLE